MYCLTNRKQFVSISDVESNTSRASVHQDSILDPLLFLNYINDLPHFVKYFKILMYADDTTLCANL